MADPRWRTPKRPFHLQSELYLQNFMSSKNIHSENVLLMPFIPQKSIFTPSGTVFSNFIALELLSKTLRSK